MKKTRTPRKESMAVTIRDLARAEPDLSAREIADQTGAGVAYVHTVLWKLKKTAAEDAAALAAIAEAQKFYGAQRAEEIEARAKGPALIKKIVLDVAAPSPLETQVDGDHYKKLAIQPVEYIHANGIPFIEGSIIKYATRWRDKGGVKDLEKIKHFVDLLIEMETTNGFNS